MAGTHPLGLADADMSIADADESLAFGGVSSTAASLAALTAAIARSNNLAAQAAGSTDEAPEQEEEEEECATLIDLVPALASGTYNDLASPIAGFNSAGGNPLVMITGTRNDIARTSASAVVTESSSPSATASVSVHGSGTSAGAALLAIQSAAATDGCSPLLRRLCIELPLQTPHHDVVTPGFDPANGESSPYSSNSASATPMSTSSSSTVAGKGAHGTVYTAVSPFLGVEVAVKTIDIASCAERLASAEAEAAFAERAAQRIASVSPAGATVLSPSTAHEQHTWAHICRVYGASVDKGTGEATVVTEALHGGTLKAAASLVCADREKAPDIIRSVARDLCAALQVLHDELGVLHNDLKLDNAMFAHELCLRDGDDDDHEGITMLPPSAGTDLIAPLSAPTAVPGVGAAKLIDFGCCTVLPPGSDANAGSFALPQRGALKAMSPERLKGGPYNAKADVWAMGVMLLQLARAGKHPFLSPPASAAGIGTPHQQSGSTDTFWRLAAALQFVDGPDACRAATARLVSKCIADGVLAGDGAFSDFVSRALDTDPATRASAAALSQHPWLR